MLAARLASIPLILGSGSASRQAILRECGLGAFTICKPDIDEKAIRFDDPEKLVMALGVAKAAAILERKRGEDALIITGDQVVVAMGGRILEKPESEAEAREFIASYANEPPCTVGSCVITDAKSGQQFAAIDTATVHFRPIPTATIDALVAEGSVYACAGGLMVEHPLVQPHVARMDGSMDSIMGLCKSTLMQLLDEACAAREQ